jgi:membrane-associated phospholipid phosphatase
MLSRSLQIVLAFVVLAAIIGIEFAYRKPLNNSTIKAIHRMQEHETSGALRAWKSFSDSGVGTMPIFVLVMTIDYTQRARQVYWMFLITALYTIQNITKMAYTEARPFWVDPTVFAKDCSGEFGNPSGHTMTAVVLSFGVMFEIVSTGLIKNQVLAYALLLPLAVTYSVMMAITRMMLGAHAIN